MEMQNTQKHQDKNRSRENNATIICLFAEKLLTLRRFRPPWSNM
jgi:hypothetical protein